MTNTIFNMTKDRLGKYTTGVHSTLIIKSGAIKLFFERKTVDKSGEKINFDISFIKRFSFKDKMLVVHRLRRKMEIWRNVIKHFSPDSSDIEFLESIDTWLSMAVEHSDCCLKLVEIGLQIL